MTFWCEEPLVGISLIPGGSVVTLEDPCERGLYRTFIEHLGRAVRRFDCRTAETARRQHAAAVELARWRYGAEVESALHWLREGLEMGLLVAGDSIALSNRLQSIWRTVRDQGLTIAQDTGD